MNISQIEYAAEMFFRMCKAHPEICPHDYCWSGTTYNKDIYNLILKKIGKPKLTVILYATPEAILARLKKRDINDSDIAKVSKSEKAYEKMIYFCETKKLEYIVIDTTNKDVETVVDEILKRIEVL